MFCLAGVEPAWSNTGSVLLSINEQKNMIIMKRNLLAPAGFISVNICRVINFKCRQCTLLVIIALVIVLFFFYLIIKNNAYVLLLLLNG
jgi:hypothetical protein